jgi:GTP-binding protein YchF
MRIGIVGLPRAGKTTIFNALTGAQAATGSFGAGGKKANLGVIKVPDPRLDRLAEIFEPKKLTYAEITFADIPGAAEGAEIGKEAATVDLVKGTDAIALVVRAFGGEEVPHPKGSVNPARDIADVEAEFALLDLIAVERRLERMQKERKSSPIELEAVKKAKAWLEADRPVRTLELTADERKALAGFRLLSEKPVLVVVNLGEGGDEGLAAARAEASKRGLPAIALRGQLEMELAAIPPEDQAAFLADFGLTESARDAFVRAAYEMTDLISFLTAGDDEVRAWPIRRNTAAQPAGGKIHSDIERGFIRAEVVAYDDFMALPQKTMAKAREAGKLRLEGKDYVVKDGDIINFRFNV